MLLLYLKVTGYKNKLTIDWWAKSSNASVPPKKMLELLQVGSFDEGLNPVWQINPKSSSLKKVILYLHGGGYSKGFQDRHWKFISKLAERTGFEVWAPDYPLSVTNSAEDVFEFLVPVYQKLLGKYEPENIVFMGDSAGGGMALALAELLVQKKIEQPSQLLLLSPWLDITLSNPQIEKYEEVDLILDRKILQALGTRYIGNYENTHFLVSPIYGQIKRLPAITIFVGSEEIFLPDCRKLKVRAESEPMVFNYREFKGMVHNWMFLPVQEAETALTMIVSQLMLDPKDFEDPVNADSKFW